MGYRKNGRRRGAAESRLVSEATPDVLADVFFGSEDGASSSPRAAGNDGDQLCADLVEYLGLTLLAEHVRLEQGEVVLDQLGVLVV